MDKNTLIDKIAEKAGISKKDAKTALAAFTDTVVEAVAAGEKISLVGFGTFEAHERGARQGRNPRTGETINIPDSRQERRSRTLSTDRLFPKEAKDQSILCLFFFAIGSISKEKTGVNTAFFFVGYTFKFRHLT